MVINACDTVRKKRLTKEPSPELSPQSSPQSTPEPSLGLIPEESTQLPLESPELLLDSSPESSPESLPPSSLKNRIRALDVDTKDDSDEPPKKKRKINSKSDLGLKLLDSITLSKPVEAALMN